jgi:HSP20 family protein
MAKSLLRWDPFNLMRERAPYFNELRELQTDMGRLFDQFLGKEISTADLGHGEWMPLIESYKKGNGLVFRCELPGIDPKDVEVSFDESTHQLVIKGSRKADKDVKDEDYFYRGFAYGCFERRFTLPEGIKADQVKAKCNNGILEITAPLPAISKAKKIEVEAPKAAEGEVAMKKAA